MRLGYGHAAQLAGNLLGRQRLTQHVGHQFEALAARHKLALGATNLAPNVHLLLGAAGRVSTTTASIALQLSADGSRATCQFRRADAAQAEALSLTELNDGALFDAEFGNRT